MTWTRAQHSPHVAEPLLSNRHQCWYTLLLDFAPVCATTTLRLRTRHMHHQPWCPRPCSRRADHGNGSVHLGRTRIHVGGHRRRVLFIFTSLLAGASAPSISTTTHSPRLKLSGVHRLNVHEGTATYSTSIAFEFVMVESPEHDSFLRLIW